LQTPIRLVISSWKHVYEGLIREREWYGDLYAKKIQTRSGYNREQVG